MLVCLFFRSITVFTKLDFTVELITSRPYTFLGNSPDGLVFDSTAYTLLVGVFLREPKSSIRYFDALFCYDIIILEKFQKNITS